MESSVVTIQMKPCQQYFYMVLFIFKDFRVFNRNLNRWENFRNRWRMNYSCRRREILRGSGGMLPLEILKIWAS